MACADPPPCLDRSHNHTSETHTAPHTFFLLACRIGGLLSPYAIPSEGVAWAYTPQAVFGSLALVAAASVYLLPRGMANKELPDTLEECKEEGNTTPLLQAQRSGLGEEVPDVQADIDQAPPL